MGNCFLYKRGFGGGFGGGGGEITPEVEKTASGKMIAIHDSTENPLKGLRLFGKTTQNGTPSPTAPVPLVSAGDGGSIIVTIGTSESDANPQTLTLSTPNGLPGIHVSEGGNYTDENGWQWICDEVDFGRGVYVQRVERIVLDGSADESWVTSSGTNQAGVYRNAYSGHLGKINATGCVCNRYPAVTAADTYYNVTGIAPDKNGYLNIYDARYNVGSSADWRTYLQGNPIDCVVCLITPIETALTAEELAAYAALHTNYPSTTLYNDADSYMEVKYMAKGG